MDAYRKIDGKFAAATSRAGEGDYIVIYKESNGESIPVDEPLFLFRGRDNLALKTLMFYRECCVLDGCTEYQIKGIDEQIVKFVQFSMSNPEKMKQPGITRGL